MKSRTLKERLQCGVNDLSYNFHTRVGILHLPEDHCTDMSGAITLFETIDPDCQMISTIAGNQKDTVYLKSDGDWIAAVPEVGIVRGGDVK